MQIMLSGYYGKGNFGDDVLLAVASALLRNRVRNCQLVVRSSAEYPQYIKKIAGADVEIVPYGIRRHFDLIVHGGGGVFFDFDTYGHIDRLTSQAIGLVGPKLFVAAEDIVRHVLNRKRTTAHARVGLGLGVGHYAKGSTKLRNAWADLLDFDFISVRDSASVDNLERLGLGLEPFLGSDLAFLGEYWASERNRVIEKRESGFSGSRPKLGLILRDWPVGAPSPEYTNPLHLHLSKLGELFDITNFVFDATSDSAVIRATEGEARYVWDPELMDISQFAAHLAEQDVLVTSRAHGAICGAVLGVPSLILEIEEKLSTIHHLLPNATRRVSPVMLADKPFAFLLELLREIAAIKTSLLVADVERNRLRSLAMVDNAFECVAGRLVH